MTAKGEQVLMQSLFDPDALDALAREGLPYAIVPTRDYHAIISFALNYFHSSGRLRAPTPAVFAETLYAKGVSMLDVLNDHEIPTDELPEEDVVWAIEDLRATYVHKTHSEFVKEFATAMSNAPTVERVSVFNEFTSRLAEAAMVLDRRSNRSTIQTGLEHRVMAYEDRAANNDVTVGMTFGMPAVDQHTYAIHPGELAMIAAYAKVGKAQPLDTPVLTPAGWTTMGALVVGDEVVGQNGRSTRVVAVHPQGEVPVFRVVMSDGSSTRVCAHHLWQIRGASRASLDHVVATAEIRERLLDGGGRRRFYIPVVQPVEHPPANLPLDPYLLGLLIGDGGMTGTTVTLTSGDGEIFDSVEAVLPWPTRLAPSSDPMTRRIVGHVGRINPLNEALRDLGLMRKRCENKFIPGIYMMGSVEQRWALLQGLMDTDGEISGKRRTLSISSASERLMEDLVALVEGLGGTCRGIKMRQPKRAGIDYGLPSYRVAPRLPSALGAPFRLGRKRGAWLKLLVDSRRREPCRQIVAIEAAGTAEAQCITVDAPDGLYVTERHIVTHNSFFVDRVAFREQNRNRTVALVSLENSIDMTIDRLACQACGVNTFDWERGRCDAAQVERIKGWAEKVKADESTIHVLRPEPGQRTPQAIVRMAQVLGADTLIIDQLSHMEHPDAGRGRKPNVIASDILYALKDLISGRDPLPCLLAHQINRDGKRSADKIGHHVMSDLAETSASERVCDFVFAMYQSNDQFALNRCLFQMLAARRVPVLNWLINWAPHIDKVSVIKEVSLGG